MRCFHCSCRLFREISRWLHIALRIPAVRLDCVLASWYARVVKNFEARARSPLPLEKKKLPPSRFSLSHVRATVRAMVDFPVPAIPFNQKMHASPGLFDQCTISWRRPTRVSSKHIDSCSARRELNAASWAQWDSAVNTPPGQL